MDWLSGLGELEAIWCIVSRGLMCFTLDLCSVLGDWGMNDGEGGSVPTVARLI